MLKIFQKFVKAILNILLTSIQESPNQGNVIISPTFKNEYGQSEYEEEENKSESTEKNNSSTKKKSSNKDTSNYDTEIDKLNEQVKELKS